MWVVGDWGQASPWSRDTGVKMVNGENDVWTGKLTLPKGTKFDIKILKSTVSTTSGGDNTWSAVRYVSTLNMPASHDFGEFTDNLVPNGDFDEGQVKWTPTSSIINRDYAESTPYLMLLERDVKCVSDVFTVPANQYLAFSGYARNADTTVGTATIAVESVEPQQQTLFEIDLHGGTDAWAPFSGSFNSGDVPTKCRVVATAVGTGSRKCFDSLSLVSK